METIIQAGSKRLKIVSVPVETNPKTRESRLFKSMFQHVRMSAWAIIRAFIMYRPYVIFTFFAGLFALLGITPFVRYAALQVLGSNDGGHLQSLLVGAVLLIMAFLSVILGVVADLIRTNRTLIEDNLEHTKKIRFAPSADLTLLDLRSESNSPRRLLNAVSDDLLSEGNRRASR
jgi:hypothetical protein